MHSVRFAPVPTDRKGCTVRPQRLRVCRRAQLGDISRAPLVLLSPKIDGEAREHCDGQNRADDYRKHPRLLVNKIRDKCDYNYKPWARIKESCCGYTRSPPAVTLVLCSLIDCRAPM